MIDASPLDGRGPGGGWTTIGGSLLFFLHKKEKLAFAFDGFQKIGSSIQLD